MGDYTGGLVSYTIRPMWMAGFSQCIRTALCLCMLADLNIHKEEEQATGL